MGVHTFPESICSKLNVIARLEYELAYYDSGVHRFNHYTTRTPPKETVLPVHLDDDYAYDEIDRQSHSDGTHFIFNFQDHGNFSVIKVLCILMHMLWRYFHIFLMSINFLCVWIVEPYDVGNSNRYC